MKLSFSKTVFLGSVLIWGLSAPKVLACTTHGDCNDGVSYTRDLCQVSTGTCVFEFIGEGSLLDRGNYCLSINNVTIAQKLPSIPNHKPADCVSQVPFVRHPGPDPQRPNVALASGNGARATACPENYYDCEGNLAEAQGQDSRVSVEGVGNTAKSFGQDTKISVNSNSADNDVAARSTGARVFLKHASGNVIQAFGKISKAGVCWGHNNELISSGEDTQTLVHYGDDNTLKSRFPIRCVSRVLNGKGNTLQALDENAQTYIAEGNDNVLLTTTFFARSVVFRGDGNRVEALVESSMAVVDGQGSAAHGNRIQVKDTLSSIYVREGDSNTIVLRPQYCSVVYANVDNQLDNVVTCPPTTTTTTTEGFGQAENLDEYEPYFPDDIFSSD